LERDPDKGRLSIDHRNMDIHAMRKILTVFNQFSRSIEQKVGEVLGRSIYVFFGRNLRLDGGEEEKISEFLTMKGLIDIINYQGSGSYVTINGVTFGYGAHENIVIEEGISFELEKNRVAIQFEGEGHLSLSPMGNFLSFPMCRRTIYRH